MLKKTKRKPIHSELYQAILKKLRGLYLYAQFCRRYRETFSPEYGFTAFRNIQNKKKKTLSANRKPSVFQSAKKSDFNL